MLENRFVITAEGLTEISRRLILHTKRFVTASLAVPAVVILLAVVVVLANRTLSPLLVGAVVLIFLAFFGVTLSKTPKKLSAQFYADMKRKANEPQEDGEPAACEREPEMHTRLSDDAVVLLDAEGEPQRQYSFESIRLVFGTARYLVAVDCENKAVYWKRDAFLDGGEQDLLRILRESCKDAKFSRSVAAA